MNITLEASLAKLPIDEIKQTIHKHIAPFEKMLPDKRLERGVDDMILGILGGESPVVTEMARQNNKEDGESWATAKRIYRLLENERVKTREFYEGLYQVGCEAVAQEAPEYLVAGVDPVNFEKPYVKKVEGASIVHKATPTGFDWACPAGARLSSDYGHNCEHASACDQLCQLVFV